jgi:protein tyrosine phosphatase (PTP) superfamily phosphohydrolase (DUF442 family)
LTSNPTLLVVLLLCASVCAQETAPKVAEIPESRPASEARYESLGDLPGVQRVTRFSDRLYRGAQPQDVKGMLELRKLGVTAIIAVEEPDKDEIDAGAKAGIRVVNIPTEYGGFPQAVVDELVATYRKADETIYVHCHHGKHRGGAAAAILRMTFEGIPQLEAVQELAELGCSKRYPGLYETVRKYRPDPAIAHRVLKPRPGIDGLIEVTPWVLRGTSALPPESLAALKDLGVTSILSADMAAAAQERARAAGLSVTLLPVTTDREAADQRGAVVRALAEKKREKIFIHATGDPERVALMVAYFRIALSHWTAEEAAKEVDALLGPQKGGRASSILRAVP